MTNKKTVFFLFSFHMSSPCFRKRIKRQKFTQVYGKPSFKDDILATDDATNNANDDFENKVIWGWRNIAAVCDIKELLRLCRVCRSARRHLRWHSPCWQSTTLIFDIGNVDRTNQVKNKPRFWVALGADSLSIPVAMGPRCHNVFFFRQLLLMVNNIEFNIREDINLLDRSQSSVLTWIETIGNQPHCLANVTCLKDSLPLLDLQHLAGLISFSKLRVLHPRL